MENQLMTFLFQLVRNKYTQSWDTVNTKTLWELKGSQGDHWILASVHIGSSPIIQFQFIGTIGDGYQGDIAIDDVIFMNCQGILAALIYFTSYLKCRSLL